MQRNRGITRLVDELGGELLKIMTHARTIEVPLVRAQYPTIIPPLADSSVENLDCGILSKPQKCQLPESEVVIREFTSPEPVLSKVDTEFEPGFFEIPSIVPSQCLSESTELMSPTARVQRVEKPGPTKGKLPISLKVGIAPRVAVEVRPQPPGLGKVRRGGIFGQVFPRRGADRIAQYPLIVKASPWEIMDRSYIVACWELLRGQAVEELGNDPGKDLEMLAIFPGVDTSWVRRIGFDASKRQLLLYPHCPVSIENPTPRSCAIIIGTIKGTGRLFQTVLSEDPRKK